MSSTDRIRVIRADDAFALGTYRDVIVMIWCGEPTVFRLEAVQELIESHAAECGGKVGVLSVLEAGAPAPDPGGRERVAADQRALAPNIWGFAVLVEDVDPTYVIDVSYELDEARGLPLRLRHCTDAREATTWLAAQCPPEARERPTREGLLEAIDTLRAAIASVTA